MLHNMAMLLQMLNAGADCCIEVQSQSQSLINHLSCLDFVQMDLPPDSEHSEGGSSSVWILEIIVPCLQLASFASREITLLHCAKPLMESDQKLHFSELQTASPFRPHLACRLGNDWRPSPKVNCERDFLFSQVVTVTRINMRVKYGCYLQIEIHENFAITRKHKQNKAKDVTYSIFRFRTAVALFQCPIFTGSKENRTL